MVAEAAVSFAVEKLGEAVINKVAFLQGVEEQVNLLKDELERMYGFLQDASQKQATDNGIRVWISQIRQVAHDVEDVIETFNLKIDTPRSSRGMLENCTCFPSHLKHLNKLGKEIESIRARLKDIFESRTRYGIQDLGEGSESRRPNIAVQRRRLLPQQTDKDVVGLEKDVDKLLGESILNDSPGLSIARITGMGGLGKSTLAREVYNNAAVASRFDFRAWVVVSEEFDSKEVIRKLLLQLVGSEDEMKKLSVEKLSVEELKGKFLEQLRGREYFIVLDDVWEQQHWEVLADAFPNEQDKRSRLLVTSRNNKVPWTARYAHELKHLDLTTSWRLFLRKSFIDDTNGECPPELEDIGRVIAEKCGGLPLAITVVGGLLLKEGQSRSGWQKILRGMNFHLGRSENSVSAILELSYHDLPPRLKSCFLCLGFFKEDAIIRAEKLRQVWIAEGLISLNGREEETMEEIAGEYLDELINRNMVQIKDMNIYDQVESCQIHDLLRELSINKAEQEIGFKILREGINSQASDKSRHRAIYCSSGLFSFSKSPNDKHVRSLFFHSAADRVEVFGLDFKSFTLLRVLDFEGFGLERLPKSIGELIGLKYLGLRENRLRKLPKSLGRLKNLEVLDITNTFYINPYIKVPNVIWKLYNLRHLNMQYFSSDAPLRLDTLKNLQTLVFFPNKSNKWWPKHLKEMTHLRRLDVYIDEYVTDVREFITSLGKLKNLASLELRLIKDDLILDGLDTLHSLTELKVCNEMSALPSVDNFPPNLSHLTLWNSRLREDPMPVLEKLPNLLYLNLEYEAYEGREMVISDDGFPRLRVLCLRYLYELRKIELVGEGHGMPELKRFEINGCSELESLPNKLMTLLQGVEIIYCPKLKTEVLEEGDNTIC